VELPVTINSYFCIGDHSEGFAFIPFQVQLCRGVRYLSCRVKQKQFLKTTTIFDKIFFQIKYRRFLINSIFRNKITTSFGATTVFDKKTQNYDDF
jgi:hypothetical protein